MLPIIGKLGYIRKIMLFVICPVCSNQDADFYIEKDGFKFWRSKNCGTIFISPLPEQFSTNVYGEDYFSGAKKGFGYVDYDRDKSAMASLFKKFLALMAHHTTSSYGQLLDIGAATGYFVELANKAGWSAQGIDISSYATKEARKKGLKVETATLDSFNAPNGIFTAITMWDVLEHLPDPVKAIKKTHDLLQPKGLLAINTPDSGSLWARIWRGKWQALVPPEHMIIFNKKALKMLLDKSGFEILELENPTKKFTPAYIMQILARSMKVPMSTWLVGILNRRPFNVIAVPLPIRDNIFVLACKK